MRVGLQCAEGGSRTRTLVRVHAPETCASTNSATSAVCSGIISQHKSTVIPLLRSAEGGSRTRTLVRVHAPETCASTNSATSANGCKKEALRPLIRICLVPDPVGTEGGNRTRTVLLPLDFESSASTNSATSACCSN